MSYIRFKHVVDGETLEISMKPDTSMQFSTRDDRGDTLREEIDVENGVLRLVITSDFADGNRRNTTHEELHCALDHLTDDDGFPAWQAVRRGEQYGI